MKKQSLLLIFILIFIFTACNFFAPKENGTYTKIMLDNTNAELYILNFSEDDINIEISSSNELSQTKNILHRNITEAENENLKKWNLNKSFLISVISKLKEAEQIYDNQKLPFDLSENDCLSKGIIEEKLKSIKISKSDGTELFCSNFEKPDTTPELEYFTSGLGSLITNKDEKNFENHDFLFTSKPGNYLFYEGKLTLDSSSKEYYGTLNSIKYVIIIGGFSEYE